MFLLSPFSFLLFPFFFLLSPFSFLLSHSPILFQMRDNYYRLGEGFLIVYSITMRDTFVSVNRFYDHILQVKGIDEVNLLSSFLQLFLSIVPPFFLPSLPILPFSFFLIFFSLSLLLIIHLFSPPFLPFPLPQVPIILVGSKCDLSDDREVPTDEGKALAQKWNCPVFETSAKTRVNVDEVFTELVRIVAKSKVGPESGGEDEGGKRNCCVIL